MDRTTQEIREDAEQLEALVDKLGLACLLRTLSEICSEKAEHVRCNWQDEALAKVWDRDAATLDKTSGKVTG